VEGRLVKGQAFVLEIEAGNLVLRNALMP